jgi:ferritin
MGTKKTRRMNIDKMRNVVRQATEEGKELEKGRFIAWFSLEQALTERSTRELLQTFINAGEFLDNNGAISYANP